MGLVIFMTWNTQIITFVKTNHFFLYLWVDIRSYLFLNITVNELEAHEEGIKNAFSNALGVPPEYVFISYNQTGKYSNKIIV